MVEEIKIEKKNLSELKRYFSSRILAIPELQRNFVWNIQRIRDLADSILKGYPIGTFTIWQAPEREKYLLKHSKGLLPPYDYNNNSKIHYVIDGQQRLSILYKFMNPEDSLITNDSGQVIDIRNICFSIRKNEEDLSFVYSKRGADDITYFSLCDILSPDYQERFYFLKKRKSAMRRIKECRFKFFNYNFGFIYINKERRETNIKDIFVRLNTRGLSLSAIDRAYAYASEVHLRERISRIKERLGVFKTINDKPIHEVIYMINSPSGSKFNSRSIDILFKKINNDFEERKKFDRQQKRIEYAVENSVNFFKSRGVISLKYLPSLTMVSVLSTFYYYHRSKKVGEEHLKELNKWFWYSAISGRYSGKGYYYAAKDCTVMRALAEGKNKKFEDMRKVERIELDNCLYYLNRSSLKRAFYCLLALHEPREFFNGKNKIDLINPTYLNKKHDHHIFPENIIKNVVPFKKYNSIINICFLPLRINTSFSDEYPYKYLNTKDIDKQNISLILKSHLIPEFILKKEDSLKAGFNKFYETRKEKIITLFEKEAGMSIFY